MNFFAKYNIVNLTVENVFQDVNKRHFFSSKTKIQIVHELSFLLFFHILITTVFYLSLFSTKIKIVIRISWSSPQVFKVYCAMNNFILTAKIFSTIYKILYFIFHRRIKKFQLTDVYITISCIKYLTFLIKRKKFWAFVS